MAGKVEAYLGFCIKARKIAFGEGTVDTLKKGVYLIMVCSTASENAFKLALKYKNRFACPLIICKVNLSEVVNKPNCKIVAIKDAGLAQAIADNANEDYELYVQR